jgi:hypothetical protein
MDSPFRENVKRGYGNDKKGTMTREGTGMTEEVARTTREDIEMTKSAGMTRECRMTEGGNAEHR